MYRATERRPKWRRRLDMCGINDPTTANQVATPGGTPDVSAPRAHGGWTCMLGGDEQRRKYHDGIRSRSGPAVSRAECPRTRARVPSRPICNRQCASKCAVALERLRQWSPGPGQSSVRHECGQVRGPRSGSESTRDSRERCDLRPVLLDPG